MRPRSSASSGPSRWYGTVGDISSRPRQPLEDDVLSFPAETVLCAYLVVAAISAVVIRPPHWGWVLMAYLASATVVGALGRTSAPRRRLLRSVRALYPILLLAALFRGTGYLSVGLRRWILDEPLARIEAFVFAGHPSLYLAERVPSLALSELLHAGYFSYYLLLPCLPIALVIQGRERLASCAVFWLCFCFSLCLVCFIWLPVTSPFYRFPDLDPPLSDGLFFRLTHSISRRGGVVGGAFPSSHVALSVLNWLMAYRMERRVFRLTAIPTGALVVATVYGRFHYALDAIAGILLAVACYAAFYRIEIVPTRRSAATNR